MSDPIRLGFSGDRSLSADALVSLAGGKGANLIRMTGLGLSVPPGFILTTAACHRYLAEGWFDELDDALRAGLAELEVATGGRLGDPSAPLLVSVRSGSPVSMPGMMDTVLNVGMSAPVADALGRQADDPAFGSDTQSRFLRSWAEVVAATVPDEPFDQLRAAVEAVFASWNSERARSYRRIEHISDELGTAVTIQAMVFGNRGERSGTGVLFTRDPVTGRAEPVGDFLVGAQGEDVVAGTHATRPLSDLAEVWPDIATELAENAAGLERELTDLADIEFTIEDGRLWILQVRVGKRSPTAAVRVAVEMAEDETFPLTRAEAVARAGHLVDRLDESAADHASTPDYEPDDVLAQGLAASPGRAVGEICTDVDAAIERAGAGTAVILIRRETSPADVAAMSVAQGIVTSLGGLVSHAAVVARSWAKPAVVGAKSISLAADGSISVDSTRIEDRTTVTVDGDTGRLVRGSFPADAAEPAEAVVLRRWRDEPEAGSLAPAPPPPPPAPAAPPDKEAGSVTLDDARRLLGLKGMASAETMAEVLGIDEPSAERFGEQLVASGEVDVVAGRFRLLAPGSAAVDELFRTDAVRLAPTIAPLLDEFAAVDLGFKQLVTDWQTRDETSPDAMTSADLTASLRERVHGPITALLDRITPVEPRIGDYAHRLAAALDGLERGDPQLLAHPLRDSYHTVWFELHEELIRLSGRTRADEAEAGRA